MTFFITALIIVVMPGIGAIYTISTGLLQGRRAGFLAAFGCALGIVPHLFGSFLLLRLMLYIGTLWYYIILVVGNLYLIYLGIGMLREEGGWEQNTKLHTKKYIQTAILINLLNPKLTIFFMAFLPQFADPTSPDFTWNFFWRGGAFMLLTWGVFACYGIFADKIRGALMQSDQRMRIVSKLFGCVFLFFSIFQLFQWIKKA